MTKIIGWTVGALLLTKSAAFGGLIVSDALTYTINPGNGASTIRVFSRDFFNSNPMIPETTPGGVRSEALVPSTFKVDYNPSQGLVDPKTILLTQADGSISDILKLTVNADSSLLTFQFTSDPETPLVNPPGSEKMISIPEDGDPTHPAGNKGFLNITRDVFSGFLPGKEPLTVLVSSTDFMVTGAASNGRSVSYDSGLSTLLFANDLITDTGTPGDPIVGALVSPPTLVLSGESPDGSQFVFPPANGMPRTIGSGANIYLKAHLDSLVSDVDNNYFAADLSGLSLAGVNPSSPFLDPSLSSISSPFLQSLEAEMDPTSAGFDPLERLFIVYRPDLNFFAATAGYTTSAQSSLTNFLLTHDVVPEPHT